MRYVESVPTAKPISVIGLGTWQFGSREWGYGDAYADTRARAIVRRALELGVTLVDTAEAYAFGRSERILGEALGEDRERAYVATKILPVLPTAPVVQQRAVASAARLGVQRIDLYQVHQPNPVVHDGTTMRGMAALQRVGLVGDVGVSNYSLARWQQAEGALGGRVLSNQVQYSLVDRRPERELLPWARAAGRLVIAYSPLGQGLLSGRYDATHRPGNGVRRYNPMFLPENLERAQPLVRVLREVADAHDVTPSQVALAWVVHDPHVVAIPGASSVEQLEANAAAADLRLPEDEVTELGRASDRLDLLTGGATLRPMLRTLLRRDSTTRPFSHFRPDIHV
ncbi:aldo/keto reductase [Lapillicoccus jejuensis]|uniref:aldo/keto reductase n=1 Tax=Lapillicoccus jejuensis TaxID=402171 RepID=UPI0011534C18|nr:aldo/keto reductase [Lapillicoccus jejuensis]